MSSDTPQYDGKPLEISLNPIGLKKSDYKFIQTKLENLLRDLEKFAQKSASDPETLKTLGLPSGVDYSPTPLGIHIPFCRFDCLWDGRKLSVLELNTDGTSGYNIVEWLGEKAGLKSDEDPNRDLSIRLLNALREHAPKAPEALVADFPDVKTKWEQEDLVKRWNKVFPSRLISVSGVGWKKGDVVLRRALGWELRAKKDQCRMFLDAWTKGEITVVGGFSSDIGMSKVWPTFVNSEVLPKTLLVGSEKVIDKNRWVLKMALSYSGRGVYRGDQLREDHWDSLLEKAISETKSQRPWVLQERMNLPQYEGRNLELGFYFLNGKMSGVMARWGHSGEINESSVEILRPVKLED